MDEGFILSNKYRKAVFGELASGETDIKRIAKKHHIFLKIVERVMEEFVKGGIVERKGNRYYFTKKGRKLLERIGR
jgi:predicted transcriptional regulator